MSLLLFMAIVAAIATVNALLVFWYVRRRLKFDVSNKTSVTLTNGQVFRPGELVQFTGPGGRNEYRVVTNHDAEHGLLTVTPRLSFLRLMATKVHVRLRQLRWQLRFAWWRCAEWIGRD